MIRFECDYLEGAPVQVIEAIAKANMEQNAGYGEDAHCEHAKELIRQVCDAPEAKVAFLVGGTQTNLTVIASALKNYQGVIAPQTAHINNHETGAIEATGHKVMSIPTDTGKITGKQVRDVCRQYWNDTHALHIVQPGMVYISQTTEIGTLYSRREIEEIYAVCREYHILLFIDGARIGYGIESPGSDLKLHDFPKFCDVFTIGGTKQGALFGEAVVILDKILKQEFSYHVKQRGGLLAKGWLLGVQFETLFTDGLYIKLAKHAADLAVTLHQGFASSGFSFYVDHLTNQQLPILTREQAEKLGKNYSFDYFASLDDGRLACRFCTSWATREENVEALLADIKKI